MNFINNNEPEHNTGSDRYLITYADLITLLLGLFVILYASSQVDQEKFKEYSAAFSEYFTAKEDKILQGGDGVLQGNQKGVPKAILNPASSKSISEINLEISKSLSKYIKQGSIEIKQIEGGFAIVMPEKMLFESARANIQPFANALLDTLAGVLKGINMELSVDGHTDAIPIQTFQYESNWHLSVARATNVAYSLLQKGVPGENLVIRGFGSQRPVGPNNNEFGRAKNRRVEITIKEKSANSPTTNGYSNNRDTNNNE
jgi:chemotaxis protein MotB